MRNNNGSGLAQYAVIIALVALVVVPAFLILGNNIKSILDSYNNCYANSNMQVASNSGLTPSENSEVNTNTNMPINDYGLSEESVLENNITYNDDGSISFSRAGRDINIPSRLLELNQLAVETTGTNGTEKLITEIAYLLDTYESENSGEEIPIDIALGTSTRSAGTATWEGNAEVSAAYIKIGDRIVVLQTDQSCVANGKPCSCMNLGLNRLEGIIAAEKTNFLVTPGTTDLVDLNENNYLNNNGLEGSVNTDNGLNIAITAGSLEWNIDFSNPENTFSL